MQSGRSSGWPHRSGVCNFGRVWTVFLENTGSKVTHAEVSSWKPPYRSQFTLESWPQILCLGGLTDKISLFAVSSLLWWGTSSTFCIPPWTLHKTDALPIHPVLLPVSGVSDAVLKPYALLNSSRILPSRPISAALRWLRTLGCREGGPPGFLCRI